MARLLRCGQRARAVDPADAGEHALHVAADLLHVASPPCAARLRRVTGVEARPDVEGERRVPAVESVRLDILLELLEQRARDGELPALEAQRRREEPAEERVGWGGVVGGAALQQRQRARQVAVVEPFARLGEANGE